MKDKNEKIAYQSNKCTVTEIYKKKSGYLNPAIVTFLNGELKERGLDLSVDLTPADNGTRVEIRTSYGHVYKQSNVSERPIKSQILAVRNKKSNKIRLVEVDNAVLINSALITTVAPNTTSAEYSKEIKNLYRAFGGKKAVSQVVKAEKLNFSSMPVADELKQTIAEIKVDTDVSLYKTEAESIADLLPPCHRDTDVVTNIYRIEEILSESELESLIKEVKVIEENKFNPKEYSEFFVHCYSEAKKHEKDLMTRLAGILFAEALIQFLKIPPRKLASKKVVVCSFSAVISEKLLREFCIRKEFSVSRPQNMKDKCVFYIIAVCLICCNYEINLQLLQTAIPSITLSRLGRLARVVGAVPLSKEGYLYTLKLPLPSLPRTPKGRQRRK